MRTLTLLALSLTACHQTLPPLDDAGGAESTTGTPNLTTITPPTTGTDTTETPTSSGTSTTTTGDDTTGTSTTDATLTTVPLTSTTSDDTTSDSTSTTEDSTGGTTLVPVCGDGVVEGEEECDAGMMASDVLQGACRPNCKEAGCGDGVVDFVLMEQCDDANTNDGDGCSSACAVEATASCGNGTVDRGVGESCDDGNKQSGDGCSSACIYEPVGGAACGNGMKAASEVCDDGNQQNGDACNPTCNLGNKTTLFVGNPGVSTPKDGVGMGAQISGTGAMVIVGDKMYLADGGNDAIRQIDLATGTVVTIAGSVGGVPGYSDNPIGLMARFNDVQGITSDGQTLWVGDKNNRRLRSVSLTAPYAVQTVACSGVKGFDDGDGVIASCDDLRGLTYYKGLVYMVDANTQVLRSFDPVTTTMTTLAGVGDVGLTPFDGYGTAARFVGPRHMSTDSSGLLYISDTDGSKVRTYNIATTYVGTLIGKGVLGHVDGDLATALVARPRGLASDGTSVYFTDFEQHTLRQVGLADQTVSTNLGKHCDGMLMCPGGYVEGTGTAALLFQPYDVVYHHAGKALYVLDSGNKVLRKVQ